jgi:hypothetical protein
MRAVMLAFGMPLCFVSASIAMPLGHLPVPPNSIQVHGCHHHYAQDASGWHRHDKDCRSLRGLGTRKSQNPAKS